MTVHQIKVDWLSLVFPILPVGEGDDITLIPQAIEEALMAQTEYQNSWLVLRDLEALPYGRAPYDLGWKHPRNGVTVWASTQMPHFTIEFSGVGMDYLREHRIEDEMLRLGALFASRLDVAIDVETELQPEQFISARKEGRQKSNGTFNSQSGTTVYIGSRHSERYMRVYRYHPPHPRAAFLRSEIVLRRAFARVGCGSILTHGLSKVARGLSDDFGISEAIDWDVQEASTQLKIGRPERGGKNTLSWMIKSAAPAFRRLVKEGVIDDPVKFLIAYFLDDDAPF